MWGAGLGLELFLSSKIISIFVWEFKIALRANQSFMRWVLRKYLFELKLKVKSGTLLIKFLLHISTSKIHTLNLNSRIASNLSAMIFSLLRKRQETSTSCVMSSMTGQMKRHVRYCPIALPKWAWATNFWSSSICWLQHIGTRRRAREKLRHGRYLPIGASQLLVGWTCRCWPVLTQKKELKLSIVHWSRIRD